MTKITVNFYAHEKDVTRIVRKLQGTLKLLRYQTLSIGNCGWANAPDCWWIRFTANLKERKEIVDWILDQGIELYNPELIY